MPQNWDTLYEQQRAAGTLPSQLTGKMLTAPLGVSEPRYALPTADEPPVWDHAQYVRLLWKWWGNQGWPLERVVRTGRDIATTALEDLCYTRLPRLGGMTLEIGPNRILRYGPPGALAKNKQDLRVRSIVHRAYEEVRDKALAGLPKHKPGKPLPEPASTVFLPLVPVFHAETASRATTRSQQWDYGYGIFGRWIATELRARVDWKEVQVYDGRDSRTQVVIAGRIYTSTGIRKFLESQEADGAE